MLPSKDYIESISKKLDSLNKFNSFNPQNNKIIQDDFDFLDHMGKSALNYLNKKVNEPVKPDPLFKDHNNY